MLVITAKSIDEAWTKSITTVQKEGIKISGIQEIPNLAIVLTGFKVSADFDNKFRAIFGHERIDYASSVVFVQPKKSVTGSLAYVQNDPKAKWTASYWGRMICWKGQINQIAKAIDRLSDGKNTKMISIAVYDPESDHKKVMGGIPCLTAIDIKPRNGELYVTAFFRSTRLSKSGYADMFALCRLAKFVARQSGTKVRSITMVTTSAHIFYSGDEAQKVSKLLGELQCV